MTGTTDSRPVIISSGEPAGIGLDLIIQLAQRQPLSNTVVLADPDLLTTRASLLNLTIDLIEYHPKTTLPRMRERQICIWPIASHAPVTPGYPDPANARYVLTLLDKAVNLCLEHRFSAMVTAPLNKAVINQAGIEFTGHTEYLARHCRASTPTMLLSCPQMRLALVTTHIPIKRVSQYITATHLSNTLQVIHHDLGRYFSLANPSILVCGLNPHAGEAGVLGDEEIHIITPVIKNLKKQGIDVHGPVSADTAFSEANRARYDVFVAMYHDQGLPVLKTLGFGKAVNITLGLPIIRTSVDHGTALTLVGSGKADTSSLSLAIETALTMCKNLSCA